MTCSPVPLSFQTIGDHWITEDELKFLHKDVDLNNRPKLSGGRGGGGGRKQKTTLSPPGKKHKIKSLMFSFVKRLES